MADLIGKTFGGYQIVAQVGRGGMATIYKAYQPSLDRDVAIKVLPPYYAEQDDSFITRFKREARSIAKLRHPNILMVHDFGEEGEIAYIVMEYVEAGTMKDVLEEGMLPLKTIYNLVNQTASALDYAHEQGVVHRDIKPSNILMPKKDWALLTDFGLAKMVGGSLLTQSGLTVGTPAYMSPEQGSGEKVDARTDVYSLGVMLYEMTIGEVPYQAETPMAVVVKHIVDPLPMPREKNPNLPEELQRVILKALAKDPNDRYQTAGEIARALEPIVEEMPDWSAAGMPAAAPTPPKTKAVPDEAPVPVEAEATPKETQAMPAEAATKVSEPKDKPEKKKAKWPLYVVGLVVLAAVIFGAVRMIGRARRAANQGQPPVGQVEPGQQQPPEQGPPPGEGPQVDMDSLPFGEYEDPFTAGLDFMDAGDIGSAIPAFQVALIEDPRNWDRMMDLLDEVEYEAGDIELAATLLQAGIQANRPGDPWVFERLGWMYLTLERYDQAWVIFHRLVTEMPMYGDGYYGLADAARATGQEAQALELVESMLNQYPEEPAIPQVLTSVYSGLGEYERAVEMYHRAAELAPEDPWTHMDGAYAFLGMGDLDAAFGAVERAVELGHDDAGLLDSAGWIYLDEGVYDRGIELLERAIQLEPDYAWAYIGIAEAYIYDLGQPERADEYLQQAVRAAGDDDPGALLSIGWAYVDTERCEQAVPLFERILEIDPEIFEAREGLDACR